MNSNGVNGNKINDDYRNNSNDQRQNRDHRGHDYQSQCYYGENRQLTRINPMQENQLEQTANMVASSFVFFSQQNSLLKEVNSQLQLAVLNLNVTKISLQEHVNELTVKVEDIAKENEVLKKEISGSKEAKVKHKKLKRLFNKIKEEKISTELNVLKKEEIIFDLQLEMKQMKEKYESELKKVKEEAKVEKEEIRQNLYKVLEEVFKKDQENNKDQDQSSN